MLYIPPMVASNASDRDLLVRESGDTLLISPSHWGIKVLRLPHRGYIFRCVVLDSDSSIDLVSLGDALRYCPTFKNVTCFGRWAKAHPALLWSFGTQRPAGIKYVGCGMKKFLKHKQKASGNISPWRKGPSLICIRTDYLN